MACALIMLGFTAGAAILGYLIAYFLRPVSSQVTPASSPNGNGDSSSNQVQSEKTKRELDKIKKRYDELYDSKLNVDTALMAAESTLEGLKMDYERLERDLSGHNNRNRALQESFDNYKSKKETEIKELRLKTRKATDNYENTKFKLAKSNRINEKLQEGVMHLKEENIKLSAELEEAKEEMEMVNASMTELKTDYEGIKVKAQNYNNQLAEWQKKYESLNLSYETATTENEQLVKAYESHQASTSSEIEKLSNHLQALQGQLEQSNYYNSEYVEAYNNLEKNHQQVTVELEERKQQAAKELAEIQEYFKDLEEDYEAIQKRESVLDQRFSSLQDKHNDLEDAYHNTVEEKHNLEEAYRIYRDSAKEEYQKLEEEAKRWLEKLESSTKELSQHKEIAIELEANKKQLMLELEKTKERYNKELSLSGGELEALNETFEGLKDKYFQVNKELSSTQLEKERISHQHEHFQEQVRGELQLIRNENKNLATALSNAKAEQRAAEQEKQALLERIEQLENFGGSTPDQAKLIKIITRLRKNVSEQQEQLLQVQMQAQTYQERVFQLEQQLDERGEHVTKDDLQSITGIDNSIVQTLEDFCVHTFADLARLSEENQNLLSQILEQPVDKIQQWIEIAHERLEA